ncbi:MAG: maleylpyruvate isomerase family mycothiol-dependent enzyme [Candidatus Limnocylindrales bacterium]
MDPRQLDRDVAGAAAAHQRLLGRLDSLGEFDAREPSLLPGWTLGHVLTHLARNADSGIRMLDGLEQYEGGAAGRHADIEAGAGRPAGDLVADVWASIWRLEQRWAQERAWDGPPASATAGEVPRVGLPFRRWRETEVHHADLGAGYTFADMPSEYVRLDLRLMEMLWKARQPMGLTPLPDAVLTRPPHERLAWLMGRVVIDGVLPAGVF